MFKISCSVLAVILLLNVISSQQDNYTLYLLSQDRDAACLDGTPVGLYVHQGKGQNKNSFMIYFNSGGFCEGASLEATLDACAKRAQSSLGTTKNAKKSRSFNGEGLLSPLQQQNPVFFDWTKVYMIYCDGSQYQGYREQPIEHKGINLTFRGFSNVMEQFLFLQNKYDFYNSDKIVITGVSAGGIATYFYSNYLFENTKKAQVYAIPDSGLFITDYYSPVVKAKIIRIYASNLFQLINSDLDTFMFPECIREFSGDLVQCENAGNFGKYLKVPMFIVESAYDQYSLDVLVQAQCLTNKNPPFNIQTCPESTRMAIERYRELTLQNLYKIKNGRSDVGLWSPSCVQHGFTDDPTFTNSNFRVPAKTGKTVSEAIQQFLDNPYKAKWYLDELSWPQNTGCNGIQQQM